MTVMYETRFIHLRRTGKIIGEANPGKKSILQPKCCDNCVVCSITCQFIFLDIMIFWPKAETIRRHSVEYIQPHICFIPKPESRVESQVVRSCMVPHPGKISSGGYTVQVKPELNTVNTTCPKNCRLLQHYLTLLHVSRVNMFLIDWKPGGICSKLHCGLRRTLKAR